MEIMESELLEIPELVRDHILGYLSPYEYLSLRRVCKTTNNWISKSPSSSKEEKKWTNFQFTIDEPNGFSFETVLETGLNITSFYLKNDKFELYNSNSAGVSEFLEIYAPRIKSLKVQNFFTFLSDLELDFFQAFVNLEELELETIDATERPSQSKNPHPLRFPEYFKNLKVLKLGKVLSQGPDVDTKFHWNILKECSNLELFGYPDLITIVPGVTDEDGIFGPFLEYIGNSTKLQCVDLQHFEAHNIYLAEFLTLAESCTSNGVKLRNVRASCLKLLNPSLPEELWNHCECIVSLINLKPAVGLINLEQLESIDIQSVGTTSLDEEWDFGRCTWPNLKTIKIHFNDKGEFRCHPHKWNFLASTLFAEEDGLYYRDEVEELSIKFDKSLQALWGRISASSITRSMPNITKLELIGWRGTNKKFLRLWNGLTELEELRIEDCETLGNVGFIGEQEDDPVFLKLTSLRKLTLKLDCMPKVTDRCFRDVLSKMRLKQFVLKSDSPLIKVTEEGISALLNGPFAQTIERFSFDTWSLADIPAERFERIGKQFRSIF